MLGCKGPFPSQALLPGEEAGRHVLGVAVVGFVDGLAVGAAELAAPWSLAVVLLAATHGRTGRWTPGSALPLPRGGPSLLAVPVTHSPGDDARPGSQAEPLGVLWTRMDNFGRSVGGTDTLVGLGTLSLVVGGNLTTGWT